MKRSGIVILICALLVCILAACGKGKEKEEEPMMPTIPNPMSETDAEGLAQALGVSFNAVEGADDVTYYIIDNKTAEMQFKRDDVKFNARVQAAVSFTDISGMFFDWTSVEDCTIGGCEGKDMKYQNEAEVCLWFDAAPGLMYSLSANPDVSATDIAGADIIAVAEEIYNPMQGDSDGADEK